MALLLKPQFFNDFSPILSKKKIILEPIALLKQVFLNFEFSRQNFLNHFFQFSLYAKRIRKKACTLEREMVTLLKSGTFFFKAPSLQGKEEKKSF